MRSSLAIRAAAAMPGTFRSDRVPRSSLSREASCASATTDAADHAVAVVVRSIAARRAPASTSRRRVRPCSLALRVQPRVGRGTVHRCGRDQLAVRGSDEFRHRAGGVRHDVVDDRPALGKCMCRSCEPEPARAARAPSVVRAGARCVEEAVSADGHRHLVSHSRTSLGSTVGAAARAGSRGGGGRTFGVAEDRPDTGSVVL